MLEVASATRPNSLIHYWRFLLLAPPNLSSNQSCHHSVIVVCPSMISSAKTLIAPSSSQRYSCQVSLSWISKCSYQSLAVDMCSAKYHLHFIASRSLSWTLNLPFSEPKFITLSKFINSRSQAQQLPTHSHNFDVLPLLVISQTRVLLPKFRIVDLVMALIQLKSVRKLFHCDVRSRLHLWGLYWRELCRSTFSFKAVSSTESS